MTRWARFTLEELRELAAALHADPATDGMARAFLAGGSRPALATLRLEVRRALEERERVVARRRPAPLVHLDLGGTE